MTRMSEWISALSPTTLTELALILFVAVFVAVAIRHGRRSAQADHELARQLPLLDDDVPTSTGGKS